MARSYTPLAGVGAGGHQEALLGGLTILLRKLGARKVDLPVAISDNADAHEQFLANATSVYLELVGRVVGSSDPPTANVVTVARARAVQRIAPASSIRAAELLHDVIMDTVREIVPATADNVGLLFDLASESVKIFMRTMTTASDEHTSALLQEVTQSHASERRRISRELHDQTGSDLAVAHCHLELARLCLEGDAADSSKAAASVDVALDGVVESMKSIREILAGLRQDDCIESLKSALESFVATSGGDSGINIEVRGDERRISDVMRQEVFLMMREVLRNAQRHSGASTIALIAEVRPSHLWVRVRDDGIGIGAPSGVGTASLRERASLLGGRVEFLTPPTGGTTVVITVPLPYPVSPPGTSFSSSPEN